ncbi:winged helix-turn-helix domain-containing protein [Sphingobium sp.]|uniref:winged helix-turn-helix domain-containing protein n=1 Tax=Sphingobium sp. TaxID=1912891 RepID=UPI00261059CA|nr:winged helix-turn-helix domain-containing protein [Sphingobium sp.]
MAMNPTGNGDPILLARIAPFRLGAVQVEPAHCLIRNDAGTEQAIEPRMMQVLVALARADGAIVTRDELIASCWGGRIVSNDAVSRVISHLRLLAGGIAAGSFQMETLPRIGYRLTVAGDDPATQPPVPDADAPAAPVARPSRRMLMVMAAGAGVAAATAWGLGRYGSSSADPSVDRSLTIAALAIDAGDPALGMIARTTVDALRGDLTRVPGLRVAGHAPGQDMVPPDPDAGGYHVDGTLVRPTPDRLRLTLSLTQGVGDQQLWSGAFDAVPSELADMQRDASAALIEQLVLRLPIGPGGPTAVAMRGDPEAYRLSETARALCDDVRERLLSGQKDQAQNLADKVAALAARSLALAPENPGGLVVMADLTRNGWSHAIVAQALTTQQRVDRAMGLLRRALRSDPANAAAMTRIADIYRRFSWRWDDATTLFRHALVNDSANIDAHWAYSHLLATLGDCVAAMDHALTLKRLADVHLWHRITLPRMLLLAGRHDAAMTLYYQELEARPDSYFLLYEIYYLLVARRDRTGLQAYVQRLESGLRQDAAIDWTIGRCRAALDAMVGHPQALVAILNRELAHYDAEGLTSATIGGRARDDILFILAIEYGCAGEYDRAIQLLDRALQAMSVYWLASLPYGDAPFPPAMQRDPRFQALWRRDARLADAVDRRRRAAQARRSSAVWSDGTATDAHFPTALQDRLDAVLQQIDRAKGAG